MATEEQILHTEYSEIMQQSYIDYAMSVIVSRALPDVRDGLKPVQRRTLYDMYELGIRYNQPYRKCARIVGDTMGKYHPHGDSSIYEALVVMAQDFKKGQILVDGHGNFGSIEGDGAAAMRYTEARLTKVSQEAYLADLDKDIVDFVPNFDETEKEPSVLPVRVPNLLINGADGIAVGMTTSIPPHNFSESVDALIAYMKKPDLSIDELMEILPGPDFPTGGIVTNKSDLKQIYETGTGKIRIRGKVEIEQVRGGKERIVITEIPYTMIGAAIGKFQNDIYSLVETKKTTDITDISNMSSKEGIRIVIDLKKGADAQNLCSLLYQKTRLEDTFGVNMLAVVDGKPETLSLKDILRHCADFQYETQRRKYSTLLDQEWEKSEVQEGLIKACDVIDLIIEILRGARNISDARECLTAGVTDPIRFRSEESRLKAQQLRFTERQANAILQMRLYKLIGLEVEALIKEHEETLAKIAYYVDLLQNKDSMRALIIKELKAYKKEYGRPRRTVIADVAAPVYKEEEAADLPVYFLMDRFEYARTIDEATYERNRENADSESKAVIPCMSSGKILLFTDQGNLHSVKVSDLPFGKFRDKGVPLDNVSQYDSAKGNLLLPVSLSQIRGKKLLFVTKQGMAKLVEGASFDVKNRTAMATKLSDGDTLLYVGIVSEDDSIVFRSARSMFLRVASSEIPEKKKPAIGVRAMKLAPGDTLSDVYVLHSSDPSQTVVECSGKQIVLNRLHYGKRDTKGVKK